MKTVFNVVLLGGILTLVGCASTPKQPRTFDQLGQYQEIPLNASSYRISFKAHPNFSYGSAEEITLLKSAQVTVQQGFDAFKVMDDPSNRINQQNQRQTVVYPSRSLHSYYGRYYPYYDPFFDAPYIVNLDPIEVSYTIQMFKTNLAPHDAFDAKRILQALGAKYGVRSDGTIILPPHPTTQKKD